MQNRLQDKFSQLKAEKRAGLVTYIMAFAPDKATSLAAFKALPKAGADIIELGLPFSDPMADGPIIQQAAKMALDAGSKLSLVLSMVKEFRENDKKTPVILMGYYNPIQNYGLQKFCHEAYINGVDGLLIVDLPIEEEQDLKSAATAEKLNWIRLIAPTTIDERIEKITKSASGFIYYVAVSGVTGTKSASPASIEKAVAKIKQYTDIPVVVGFGIKTANDVAAISKAADAIVVGSSIVQQLLAKENLPKAMNLVQEFAGALRACP